MSCENISAPANSFILHFTKFFGLFIPCVVFGAACTSVQSVQDQNATSEEQETYTEVFEPEAPPLLHLFNEARSEGRMCGEEWFDAAPPVLWDDYLTEAARMHTEDVSANALRGHLGSDGSTPKDRVEEVQFWRFRKVGEIISYFHTSDEEALQGWLDSPGHCSILMDPEFTHVGAASAMGPRFDDSESEGLYQTAKFGWLVAHFHTSEADRELLSSSDIRIFSSGGCLSTTQLRYRLDMANIPYTFVDRDEHPHVFSRSMARVRRDGGIHSIRRGTPVVIIDDWSIWGARNASELADAYREVLD